jgi:hypothetical protein
MADQGPDPALNLREALGQGPWVGLTGGDQYQGNADRSEILSILGATPT